MRADDLPPRVANTEIGRSALPNSGPRGPVASSWRLANASRASEHESEAASPSDVTK
jgi:hypothetical protein